MITHIETDAGIHVVLGGNMVTIAKSDKAYGDFRLALFSGATEAELDEIRFAELRRVEQAVQVADGLEIKGGQLYYQGSPVAQTLSKRVLSMVDEGFPLTHLVKFIENLYRNPSHRVVEHLYAFLEQGKNPITENGTFLAYKAVRGDFKDIHSGTFDNSVGAEPKVPRFSVDEDPDRTCSHGLHVCSYDYLPYFSHADGHVMVCEVDPADVVAVPRDYNNTKMRVCRYKVIAEHEGYYKQEGDMLTATSVVRTTRVADFPFTVQVLTDDSAGNAWTDDESFTKLSSAVLRAEQIADGEVAELDGKVREVRVLNHTEDTVVFHTAVDDDLDESLDNDDEDVTLQGWCNGAWVSLSAHDSEEDAVLAALSMGYEHSSYRVLDASGTVLRTLS